MALTVPPHLKHVMSENLRQPKTWIVVYDKSQGSVSTYLRCGGFITYHFYYKFTVEFAGETMFKVPELQTGRLIVWALSCVLMKNSLSILRTIWRNCCQLLIR